MQNISKCPATPYGLNVMDCSLWTFTYLDIPNEYPQNLIFECSHIEYIKKETCYTKLITVAPEHHAIMQ